MWEGITMPRVKVLYHDNCFDGAVSASLFRRFYEEKIDPTATFVFVGKAHAPHDVYDASSFDGDVNAVVDFRYSADPRLGWWFDHHVSAFQRPEDEARFRAEEAAARRPGGRPQKFFDPTARSCSKYLAESCARQFGWDWSRLAEVVEWADLIDGAQFASPKAAVELAEPALKLMTWVENNHDPQLKVRFIDELTTRPLAEIAAEPYVTGLLQPILARHTHAIDLIRARAAFRRGVVTFDVGDDALDGYNKFIPYFLYPDAAYVVGVSATPTRTKVSVGSNPWSRPQRPVNIAEICQRYGGGGHPVVGAVSLPAGQLERARQVAAEIAEELRRSVEAP
jgi:hypothetical protein